jgi:hypothetical protein
LIFERSIDMGRLKRIGSRKAQGLMDDRVMKVIVILILTAAGLAAIAYGVWKVYQWALT